MEGGAVRDLGAADRREGERGVGEQGSECDDQRIQLGERGEGCDGIRGTEPVEAWESGDLGTNCCDQILSRLSAAGTFTVTDECGVRLA